MAKKLMHMKDFEEFNSFNVMQQIIKDNRGITGFECPEV